MATLLPYSQAYQITTLVDLWDYLLLPPEKRISLRRKNKCGRASCNTQLRPFGTEDHKSEAKRIVCHKCRDILYCSQKCARRDKYRHAVECAYVKSDILKCVINEDTVGVTQFLMADPKLSTKSFGGHYILHWARRAGYQPIIDAIHGIAYEALKKALETGASNHLIQHFLDAGVTITEELLLIAQQKEQTRQLLEKAREEAKALAEAPKVEETSVYLERAKKPLPSEEKLPSFQEMMEEQFKNLTIEPRQDSVPDIDTAVAEHVARDLAATPEEGITKLEFKDPEGAGAAVATVTVESSNPTVIVAADHETLLTRDQPLPEGCVGAVVEDESKEFVAAHQTE